METTAAGIFKIIDASSDPIKKIRTAAVELDAAVAKAGKQLDGLDSTSVTTSIKTTDKNVGGLGTTAEKTSKQVSKMTNEAGRDFERMAATGTASIEELTTAIKRFEHERATATLDVDIAKAEAKIRLLKHELRTFSTAQATAELESMGLMASKATGALVGTAGGGGGGPPGAGAAGGLAGGFFAAGGRAVFMGAMLLTALPAIVAVTGAVSALVGSLSAAVGGAGAVGLGTIGAMAVGFSAIAAAAIPAVKGLGEAKKAQEKYNESIRQYGRDSAQAAQARKAMNAAFDKAPAGSKDLIDNQKVLGARWRAASKPGQADVIGIMNDAMEHAMKLLPTFARTTNQVMASVRSGVQDFFKIGSTPEVKGIIEALGNTFSSSIGPFMRAFGQFSLWVGRISVAVSPYVVRFFESLEGWMTGWANAAKNQGAVQERVGRWIGHLKSWGRLLMSTGKLLAAFFGAGAQQGKSVVESIADQFDRWTDWLKDNPGAVKDFFERTIESAGKLVKAVGEIATALAKIGDALIPLLDMFSSLTSMAGNAGLIEPLMMLGGAKFAGKMFGRGGAGAAGGAAGAGGAGAAVAGGAGMMGGARAAARAGLPVYQTGRALGASIPKAAAGAWGGAAGAAGKGAVRGAGRAFLPVAGALAAWDFASYKGNVGQRIQNAASGATLGGIPAPMTGDQRKTQGAEQVQEWMGDGKSIGQMREHRRTLKDTQVKAGAVLGDKAKDQLQGQLDALDVVLKPAVKMEQTKKAMGAVDELAKAMETRMSKPGGKAPGKGLREGLTRQLKGLNGDGRSILLRATNDWANVMANGNKRQRRMAVTMRQEIRAQYKGLGHDVRIVNGEILDISKSKWAGVRKAITSESAIAKAEGQSAFTALQRAAVDALKIMGYSKSEASKLVQGIETGAKTQTQRVPGGGALAKDPAKQSGNATGGYILNRYAGGGRVSGGIGLTDSVKVAPGAVAANKELIVNRHTENDLNAELMALGRPTLAQRVGREQRRHSQAMHTARPPASSKSLTTGRSHVGLNRTNMHAQPNMDAFAAGGMVRIPGDPDDTGGRDKVAASIAPAVGSFIKRFGIKVGYGFDPGGGHKSPGHNVTGTALDVHPNTTGWPGVNKAVGAATRAGKTVYYDGRFGSINLAPHGEGHHAHIEWGGSGAVAGSASGGGATANMKPISIKRPKSKLRGGAPKAGSERATEIIAKSMEKKINKKMGAAGGAGGNGASGAWSGGGNVRQWLTRALRITGHFSPANLNALMGRVQQESGGNPRAQNNWDSNAAAGIPSKGLIQTIEPTFNAHKMPGMDNIWNPIHNAVAAIRYMFSRYGHIVAANGQGYATGGRVGYVGDSMGVGTNPFLQKMMGGVQSNVVGGRSSTASLGALKGMGDVSKVLFDLGTNDGSAKQLRQSIMSADRMTGDAQIYVPTVNGPSAGSKNQMLRGLENKGIINTIPWAATNLEGPDGIHSTPSGYKKRAAMIARIMGNSAGGGSESGGPGAQMAGLLNATGGRAPIWGGWHAKGGEFTAHRPTVIGVGEGGAERVKVGKLSNPTGGRPQVNIKIGRIVNHEEGDIERIIDREFSRAAANIERGALDNEDELAD